MAAATPHDYASCVLQIMLPVRAGAEPGIYFFSLFERVNYINLYKNLIKIQMFNINLKTIGGQALPAPLSPPLGTWEVIWPN